MIVSDAKTPEDFRQELLREGHDRIARLKRGLDAARSVEKKCIAKAIGEMNVFMLFIEQVQFFDYKK